jgi:N-methylhydantoinase A/oxoprolinase/acetone carboxylase beta subunit
MADTSGYRIGIDVGGTFTDVVLINNATGDVSVAKVLNRHQDRESNARALRRP